MQSSSLFYIAFALSICTYIGTAATYYISSLKDASDKNSGKSPSSPWRHLKMATSIPRQKGQGLSIFLERGSVWKDEQLQVQFLLNGKLGSYGNTTLPRPAIWASRSAGAASPTCVELLDPTNVSVSDLHLAGCFNGISMEFTKGPDRSNITIEYCSFADIKTSYGAIQPSNPDWGTAIKLGFGGRVFNVTIRNNMGIRINKFLNAGSNIDGLLLESNTVVRCGGNCVSMSSSNMHMRRSVFLRDTPEQLFLYGTTDIIIGTVNGDNSIEDTDFNTRGEYEAAPDGCAVDFETSATGFTLRGNTFYRSWGAGIMVFGHGKTSQGLSFVDNTFLYDGCIQPRNDQASIALMCPGGNHPSGKISNNSFLTCSGVSAIFINPKVKGCGDNVTMEGNRINGTLQAVEQPQLSYSPPSPESTNPAPVIPVRAFCKTPHAELRYTLDGSRPNRNSPIFPDKILLQWPGPNLAVNIRGFHPDMLPSITNGVIVERRRYLPRPQITSDSMRSSFDGILLNGTRLVAKGWVVDPQANGGYTSINVSVTINYGQTITDLANIPRPDLVKAKIAPNPEHGFETYLSSDLPHDQWPIVVNVFAAYVNAPEDSVSLQGSPKCICGPSPLKPCTC